MNLSILHTIRVPSELSIIYRHERTSDEVLFIENCQSFENDEFVEAKYAKACIIHDGYIIACVKIAS